MHSVPCVQFMYLCSSIILWIKIQEAGFGNWKIIQKRKLHHISLYSMYFFSVLIQLVSSQKVWKVPTNYFYIGCIHTIKKSSHAQKRFRFIIISFKSLINPFSLNDFQSNFYKYGKWYAIVGLIWSHQPQILPMAPAYGHDMAHQSSWDGQVGQTGPWEKGRSWNQCRQKNILLLIKFVTDGIIPRWRLHTIYVIYWKLIRNHWGTMYRSVNFCEKCPFKGWNCSNSWQYCRS